PGGVAAAAGRSPRLVPAGAEPRRRPARPVRPAGRPRAGQAGRPGIRGVGPGEREAGGGARPAAAVRQHVLGPGRAVQPGRVAAVPDASGAVTVFDRTGADPPRVLRTVFKDLRTVRFTPDGRRLLGLGPDRLVEWDLSHPTTARLTGPPPLAASVAAGAIRP